MDVCAELTLRLVRFAQESDAINKTMVGWMFFPHGPQASWSEARDVLAAAAKPVMVGALSEPGAIALWCLDGMSTSERASAEYAFANQCAYFDSKLDHFGLGDDDSIVLTSLAGDFTMRVFDFRRWMREYALSLGIGLDQSSIPDTGRIVIRPPGGGRRPFGMEPLAAPSSA